MRPAKTTSSEAKETMRFARSASHQSAARQNVQMDDRYVLRNRLKLRQMTLLAALSEHGSLHKASSHLGMSQPAATRLLQELESTMGGQLFDRTPRGLQPTDMGRLLMRHAAMLVSSIDHVYEEARALRAGDAGSVRVGVFPGASPALLPRAIAMLKAATPRIDILVQEAPQDMLIAALRDGDLHLVIGRDVDTASSQDLHYEVLLHEVFCVVCSVRHAERFEGAATELEALAAHPWILPTAGTPLRSSLDAQFVMRCGQVPDDVVESISSQTNLGLLQHEPRVAVMPRSVAAYYAGHGMLKILISALPDLHGPISIATRARDTQPAGVARMLGALRATCAALSLEDTAASLLTPPADNKTASPSPQV